MSNKVLWFLAAVSLLSGTAAAEQTWVLNADGVYLQQARKARVEDQAARVAVGTRALRLPAGDRHRAAR